MNSLELNLNLSGHHPVLGAGNYADFKENLKNSNCRLCPLHEGRNNIVVDRGNPQARVMVIGEAPGENEDLQARAFVGRAGQLFDKIMLSIGINTNRDLLIANVAKCRPPENRAPKKEEAAACKPYLLRQIELVRPAVILLLGATALKHLDPSRKNFSMEAEVGRFFELEAFPGIKFLVLYHPAALLYNVKLKVPMWEHVKKLKQYLASIQIVFPPVEQA
jgi:uracil-DNA glycosylase